MIQILVLQLKIRKRVKNGGSHRKLFRRRYLLVFVGGGGGGGVGSGRSRGKLKGGDIAPSKASQEDV
jgi:hypothetical protein